MLQAYADHVAERAALGIPPLPLTAKQTAELIELMKLMATTTIAIVDRPVRRALRKLMPQSLHRKLHV